jgi:hypothetical protein
MVLLMCELVRDVLQVKGYETIEAMTAEEGIGLARGRKPDLILMDIQVPGMNGIDALRVLRADPVKTRRRRARGSSKTFDDIARVNSRLPRAPVYERRAKAGCTTFCQDSRPTDRIPFLPNWPVQWESTALDADSQPDGRRFACERGLTHDCSHNVGGAATLPAQPYQATPLGRPAGHRIRPVHGRLRSTLVASRRKTTSFSPPIAGHSFRP